jgi:outer membrane protein assembly factor BamB
MRRALPLGALSVVLVSGASASDWPQFRGPGGGAVAEVKGLPEKWGPKENVRWVADLPGRGLSCPVVAAGRVYVTCSSGHREGRLHVLCFDEASGQKLWERQFASTGNTGCHPKTCMAAPTPAADAHAVYALFATADLAALDRDGNLLWYRSLVGDYPDLTNQVGMAASPVLVGDTLVLPLDNVGDSFRAGIDTRTGKNRWRVPVPRDLNWMTPTVIGEGKDRTVVFHSSREMTGVDPHTGRTRWALPTKGTSTTVSAAASDGLIYLPGGPFRAVKPGPDAATPEVVWSSNRLATSYASPVVYRGKVWVLVNNVGLRWVDAKTGQGAAEDQLRFDGPFAASPVIADGKLYAVNEEGVTTVVRLGDRPEIVAKNALGETILATPAVADGALFLRSDKHLWCIAARK